MKTYQFMPGITIGIQLVIFVLIGSTVCGQDHNPTLSLRYDPIGANNTYGDSTTATSEIINSDFGPRKIWSQRLGHWIQGWHSGVDFNPGLPTRIKEPR